VTGEATLEDSFRRCRELNRRHGTTYYWSTYLLPPAKRPHVHALYGFCRYADDIVDDLGPTPPARRAAALASFGDRFFADLRKGSSSDPVLRAVVHTTRAFDIDPDCFRRFLRSMTMDLTVDRYATFDDLLGYMDGSAAVIGEMMLPILGPENVAVATGPARDLGIAFQVTNFLRDVAEDLDRGRVYLPQDDVERFGAAPALAGRRVTSAWVDLMRFEIDRTRAFYRSAEAGFGILPSASRRCIAGAHRLYGGILDRIEANGYDVFTRRVRVPLARKVAVVGRATLAPRAPGAGRASAAARAWSSRGTTGHSIP
jgi:phytoene synthase